MLQGTFLEGEPLGTLLCNNRCGVFGALSASLTQSQQAQAIPMGFKQEIQTGAAEILCTLSGTEPQTYAIAIEEIDYTGTDQTKNMVLHITDQTLLETSGGIVQGMSGSPILQNGKLIGAVTHVFVDDPTKGYGIFCENMYRFGISGS
jgi:stage IV sporulation protein B